MKSFKNAILSILGFCVFGATTSQADDSCLLGKWQVEEETFRMSNRMAGRYDIDLTANDGLIIEFNADSTARLYYDDYVIQHEMVRPQVTMYAEAKVNGATRGHFFAQADKALLSIDSTDNVRIETRQKAAAHPWMELDQEERDPMHAEEDFTYTCSGDELVLTKLEHDYFRAEYHGRFVRID